MKNIWFTSDLHFCHDRGFLYQPRGFTSIKEHDETIVENWNKTISNNDIVYLLGDLMLNDNERGIQLIKQLNGQVIYYIRGNHCTDVRCGLYSTTKMIPLSGSFYNSWAAVQKINGYTFYLSHYPTITSYVENMAPLKHHLINLHGHTHSKDKFYNDMPFCYNVALDAHNNYPVAFDEIISDIEKKKDECLAML